VGCREYDERQARIHTSHPEIHSALCRRTLHQSSQLGTNLVHSLNPYLLLRSFIGGVIPFREVLTIVLCDFCTKAARVNGNA
jgi:hypothetical protein